MIVKFLRRPKSGDVGEAEIYGKRMLIDGIVKENLGGKIKVVEDCKTEEERLEALKKWFRIRLTNEERTGIQGWGTELRGGGSECVMAGLKQREEVSEIYRGDGGKLTWRGLARD
jgi:hypothetical protein